jgi:hypothetical protein
MGSTAGGSTPSSTDSSSSTAGSNALTFPLGVQGDSGQLTLYVSKVPGEIYGNNPGEAGMVTSDLRRITYWLASSGSGLARQEVKLVTSDDATNNMPPNIGDETPFILAPEVRSLSFSYFDGTSWQDTWDSTAMGADGITPMGSPRAIAITIGVAQPPARQGAEPVIKTTRHVVAIVTANGATQQQNTTSP